MKKRNNMWMVILPVLACFAFLPATQAVSPAPGGCYPNFTTAEGCNALNLLTTGSGNTGLGWYALFSDSTGNFNTGLGGGALTLNNGDSNTAVGAAALLLNTSGGDNTAVGTDAMVFNDSGVENTAVGAFALFNSVAGTGDTAIGFDALTNDNGVGSNTAVGASALSANTSGATNVAVGVDALLSNVAASNNTAVGDSALFSNDPLGNNHAIGNTAVGSAALLSNAEGAGNTAVGSLALANNTADEETAVGLGALAANTVGRENTAVGVRALSVNGIQCCSVAVGYQALQNSTQSENTAVGAEALENVTTGFANTAIGYLAGGPQDVGSNNVYIGAFVGAVPGENNTIRIADDENGFPGSQCFIGGIVGAGPFSSTVTIDPATGQLGELVSSERFKKDIGPMDKASEAIFSLKPITFHYKNDKTNTLQFGLIAEEVAKVNHALIGVDKGGKPYTVRYEAVNAMLLNEFLKEHKKVEEQQVSIAELKSTVAKQQKGMDVLIARLKEQAAQIQRVSAQLEVDKPAPKLVTNKR